MRSFHRSIIALSLIGAMFLTSCEEAENQILGLWLMKSLEISVTEDGELKATSAQYFGEEEGIRWEFRDLELLFYEGRQMELEQTYLWMIDSDGALILSRDNEDEYEFEILSLSNRDLVLLDQEYETDGDVLSVIERKYTLERVEE